MTGPGLFFPGRVTQVPGFLTFSNIKAVVKPGHATRPVIENPGQVIDPTWKKNPGRVTDLTRKKSPGQVIDPDLDLFSGSGQYGYLSHVCY